MTNRNPSAKPERNPCTNPSPIPSPNFSPNPNPHQVYAAFIPHITVRISTNQHPCFPVHVSTNRNHQIFSW